MTYTFLAAWDDSDRDTTTEDAAVVAKLVRRNHKVSFSSFLPWFNHVYPLVNVYITMEHHHAINGKLTISMVIFHSFLYVYQRVIHV